VRGLAEGDATVGIARSPGLGPQDPQRAIMAMTAEAMWHRGACLERWRRGADPISRAKDALMPDQASVPGLGVER
jgi:hypothetical protein